MQYLDFRELLQSEQARPHLLAARFGVEKESQRVSLTGELATTPHPDMLGNRSYHPYIQTDFAETQMELITPVTETPEELMRWLAAIHDVAYRSMPEGELLWPLSMPPALPKNECEIQLAKLADFEDVLYRRYLARAYGRRKQMVSGIHYNFEFGDSLIAALYPENSSLALTDFKSALYMKVTRNYLRYRWLITYLMGATPQSDANYFVEKPGPVEPVRSIRNSQYGYTNHHDVRVSYEDLAHYLADIAQMVETGKLSEEKEFYAPVRLRGGHAVKDLAETGIRYIELRNIDIQPFDRYGIDTAEIQFLQLFLLLMLWLPEEKPADEWVQEGDAINNQVALEVPTSPTVFAEEGQWLLSELQTLVTELGLSGNDDLLAEMAQRLADPEQTPAARLWQANLKNGSQGATATELGLTYHQQAWGRPYQLAGFTNMELSTQIMMFDAIQQGVSVEVLDEADQFLKLSLKGHIEYVKNANMTSRDQYVVPLMMANKTVTKKVLAAAGFRVPGGGEFDDAASALQAYPRFAGKGIVVKPKSTNYGLGISVFKDGAGQADYQTAVEIAFAEDDAILVEEYLPGTEYRFFVLDGEVLAIMLRVPANVIGDGKASIKELVAAKNQDPLRGSHHRSPLELIQLGPIEQLMLKEQGYDVDSVPAAGVTVYLRENSNISTGGDSLDVTDDFSAEYKQVAADAVAALGAKISGIDLIIPDKNTPADAPSAYGIIEANFNPAMHMHVYPYQGQGRRLTMSVLKFLYPELDQ